MFSPAVDQSPPTYASSPPRLPSPGQREPVISDPFGDLMALVAVKFGGRLKTSYQGPRGYRKFLRAVFEECLEDGPVCGRYVALTNLSPTDFQRICHIHRQVSKSARITYDFVKKQLIVRFMPGPVHDSVGAELYHSIRDTILQLPGHNCYSMYTVATARFQVPGIRAKEGDQAMKPATRVAKEEWPSLVIEVRALFVDISLHSDTYSLGRLLRESS